MELLQPSVVSTFIYFAIRQSRSGIEVREVCRKVTLPFIAFILMALNLRCKAISGVYLSPVGITKSIKCELLNGIMQQNGKLV
jgi:hypothetical protein